MCLSGLKTGVCKVCTFKIKNSYVAYVSLLNTPNYTNLITSLKLKTKTNDEQLFRNSLINLIQHNFKTSDILISPCEKAVRWSCDNIVFHPECSWRTGKSHPRDRNFNKDFPTSPICLSGPKTGVNKVCTFKIAGKRDSNIASNI